VEAPLLSLSLSLPPSLFSATGYRPQYPARGLLAFQILRPSLSPLPPPPAVPLMSLEPDRIIIRGRVGGLNETQAAAAPWLYPAVLFGAAGAGAGVGGCCDEKPCRISFASNRWSAS